jgi:hypothetical protein
MTVVADSLTAYVEEVGDERPERMLIIGCTNPHDYPLPLDQLKRAVASRLGVSASQLVELSFYFDSRPCCIPLLGLLVEEFAHLSNRTDCQLVTSTRQALGLGRIDQQVNPSAVADQSRNIRPRVVKRAQPTYH